MSRELQEECYSSGREIDSNKAEYMCVGNEDVNVNLDDVVIPRT